MIGVTAFQIYERLARQSLLNQGVLVNARIVQLADRKVGTGNYRPLRENELYVKLDGFPDGQTHEGTLAKADGFADLGGTLQLARDPKNLDHWIEVRPESAFIDELMAVFLLAPVILLLLAIARWCRSAILKVWRNGELRTGVVVDSKHSSMAPQSCVCRYTIADSNDRRVFTMLYPSRQGVLRQGDALPLLVLPDQPEKSIVADLYIDPASDMS